MISAIVIALFWSSLQQINGENFAQQLLHTPDDASSSCASNASWTLLPSQNDCHKFYVCVNKNVEQHHCAANYYFDNKELRCRLGECPYDDQLKRCQVNGVQRVSGDCTAFAVCNGHKLIEQKCAANQYFAPKFASCQPISNSADHKCSCLLPPFTAIPNPDDCESYYVCIDGKAMLQQCPRGQYYSERVSGCLPDLQGICLMAPTMSPAELAMLSECEKFASNEVVFQPNTEECDKFFLCLNGRVFSRQCPKGFYFDDLLHFCQRDTSRRCLRKRKQKQHAAIPETIDSQKVDLKPKPLKNVVKRHKKNKLKVEKSLNNPIDLNDAKGTNSNAIAEEDALKSNIIERNESEARQLNEKESQVDKRSTEPTTKLTTASKQIEDVNDEKKEVKEFGSSDELNENATQRPPKKPSYDKLSSKFVNF